MISETIEKMVEAFNKHDVQAFAAFYSSDVVVHDPAYPEPLKGKDAVIKDIETFMNAFPDMTVRSCQSWRAVRKLLWKGGSLERTRARCPDQMDRKSQRPISMWT